MRDKYLALLTKRAKATKIDILDDNLKKGYEEINKQPAAAIIDFGRGPA